MEIGINAKIRFCFALD